MSPDCFVTDVPDRSGYGKAEKLDPSPKHPILRSRIPEEGIASVRVDH
jgi:hypothetical protein